MHRNQLIFTGVCAWTNGSTITIPTHTIYASKLHRDLHFQIIARDIIGYISLAVDPVGAGLCLRRGAVRRPGGRRLYPALSGRARPGVRGRLIARFAPNTKIRVRSLEDLTRMPESSIDLVVMNSVAQYMTPEELDWRLPSFAGC